MNKQTIIAFAIGALLVIAGVWFGTQLVQAPQKLGLYSVSPVFTSGATNTSSTVNTTSTQVVSAGWTQFAALTNTSGTIVWCFADNQTAASSAVAIGSGLKLGDVSSTFAGELYLTFGPTGQVPYVGAINCIASAKTSVGVIYK